MPQTHVSSYVLLIVICRPIHFVTVQYAVPCHVHRVSCLLLNVIPNISHPPSVLRNAQAECIPSLSSPVVFFSSKVLVSPEEINAIRSFIVIYHTYIIGMTARKPPCLRHSSSPPSMSDLNTNTNSERDMLHSANMHLRMYNLSDVLQSVKTYMPGANSYLPASGMA